MRTDSILSRGAIINNLHCRSSSSVFVAVGSGPQRVEISPPLLVRAVTAVRVAAGSALQKVCRREDYVRPFEVKVMLRAFVRLLSFRSIFGVWRFRHHAYKLSVCRADHPPDDVFGLG